MESTVKTEIIAIIDRSGSMGSIKDDAIGGFNAFLADQKAQPGEAKMTTILFDDQYELLERGKDIKKATALTTRNFIPRGTTALRDAIGRALTTEGERIANDDWADKVIVVILTDGHENASREYSAARIKEMTAHAEKHGWVFVFLAANQDAFVAADSYGISKAHATSFQATGAGTQSAYRTISSSVSKLRAS